MARRRGRLVRQATMDALLRFGPEQSGLRALAREAYSERRQGIAQAKGTAASITNAIDMATPRVKELYDAAGLAQAAVAHTLVSHDLAGLGPAADRFKAAGATEQAGLAGILENQQAATLGDLQQQRVSAQQGRQFATTKAQNDFVDSMAKVLARAQDLRREKGAFQATDLFNLRQDRQDRRQTLRIAQAGNLQKERNSLRSAGIDPNTGKMIPGGPLDPDANNKAGNQAPSKGAKPRQQDTFNSRIQQALTALKSDVDPDKKVGRVGASHVLTQGLPAKKGKDASGVVQTLVPELKAITDPLAIRVANDIYYDGHVSYATIDLLRKNGYRVKAIPGAPVWSRARSRAQARERARRAHPTTGSWMQDLATTLGG
jgi:uncharacterized protein (UPF0305 family)